MKRGIPSRGIKQHREVFIIATITNQATLSYSGGVISSNITAAELTETLAVVKTAVSPDYEPDGTVSYVVSLINSGEAPLTVSVSDDLGGYEIDGAAVYPLRYHEGSLRLFVNGMLQPAPAVTAGPPLAADGVTVPAGGEAVLAYEAEVTPYAPLGADAQIKNTVTVTGAALAQPLTASAEVSMETGPKLTVTKTVSPDTVAPGDTMTYAFTIRNAGASAADDVVLTDMFDPALGALTAALDGTPLTLSTDYAYSETTGVFATTAGAISVPAASYAQNADGTWGISPGETVLTVTGTV